MWNWTWIRMHIIRLSRTRRTQCIWSPFVMRADGIDFQLRRIRVWIPVFLPEWLRGFAYVCGRGASALTACQHWLISGYMRQRQLPRYYSANTCHRYSDYRCISITLISPCTHTGDGCERKCFLFARDHSNEPYAAKQPLNLAAFN